VVYLSTDNAELNPDDSLKDIFDGNSGGQLKGIIDSWEVGRMDHRVRLIFIPTIECVTDFD